jgi:hypothetical protein
VVSFSFQLAFNTASIADVFILSLSPLASVFDGMSMYSELNNPYGNLKIDRDHSEKFEPEHVRRLSDVEDFKLNNRYSIKPLKSSQSIYCAIWQANRSNLLIGVCSHTVFFQQYLRPELPYKMSISQFA